MCAAIWSAPLGEFSLHFPAESLVRYLWNHQLLSATDAHSTWRTVKGGSRIYIEALTKQVMKTGRCKIFTETAVNCMEESTNGSKILRFDGGDEVEYDHVIFATHADATRRLLGKNATIEEASLLDKFQFTDNEVVLHSDLSVSLSHIILDLSRYANGGTANAQAATRLGGMELSDLKRPLEKSSDMRHLLDELPPKNLAILRTGPGDTQSHLSTCGRSRAGPMELQTPTFLG